MIQIISVHPSVTIVASDQTKAEIPTAWFPVRPEVGQTWDIDLRRVRHDQDAIDQLNTYIARD